MVFRLKISELIDRNYINCVIEIDSIIFLVNEID